MIRRAILKAIAIPGYQVPFASREMPMMPYGWGTGGVQVTAAILGPRRHAEGDRSGCRRHHQRCLDPRLLREDRQCRGDHGDTRGDDQSRPATASRKQRSPKDRCWSTRCRSLSRCAFSSRARPRRAPCTRSREYGLMHVKLYEDIARHGHIATTYAYPVKIEGRYVMDPSPIPNTTIRRWTIARRCSCSAPAERSASTRFPPVHAGGQPRLRGPPVQAHQVRSPLRVVCLD